jgi:hypothetical protein
VNHRETRTAIPFLDAYADSTFSKDNVFCKDSMKVKTKSKKRRHVRYVLSTVVISSCSNFPCEFELSVPLHLINLYPRSVLTSYLVGIGGITENFRNPSHRHEMITHLI